MPERTDLPNPFVIVTAPSASSPASVEALRFQTRRFNVDDSRTEFGADPAPSKKRAWGSQTEPLDSSKLVNNFDDAMSILQHLFSRAEDTLLGGLRLDTMEVNLEVTAEGKLAFLGTGGSLSGKTSFTLTFKRPEASTGA